MKGWTKADIERLKVRQKFSERFGAFPANINSGGQIPPKKKAQPEYQMQAAFVREMSIKYPTVLVFSDTAAHIKKTKIQQVRANKLSSPDEKQPDVFIAKPCGGFHGIFFEFKAESPFLKDGATLKKNPHIEAQARTMAKLEKEGYFCAFVWSVEHAIRIFETLLKS